MQFISVRDLRSKSAQVWKDLSKKREMVITSKGKPIAIISSVSQDTLEQALNAVRTARAMQVVETVQMRSVKMGLDKIGLDEINKEIQAARRERAK